MHKMSTRLVLAVLVLGWFLLRSSSYGGQAIVSAQTVDEVIEKHLTALGGRAALAKLESRLMVGTITLSTPGGEVSGPIEALAARPNKQRTLIKIDLASVGAGEVTVDQRFDGTNGYMLDSLQGDRAITGSQLEMMRASIFPTQLLDYKERGAVVELKGKEKLGDSDVFALVFTPKGGTPVRQYIDATTFLPRRMIATVDVPGMGALDQVSDFLDQRDVDGVKVPFVVKSTSAAQSFTINVTRVEHNVKVDPALFVKPAGK
jgi:hypothetical protein